MILTKSSFKIIGTAILLALTFFWLQLFPIPHAEASTELSTTYTNDAYGFSVKIPADFSAYPADAKDDQDETGAPIGQAIVLQNTAGDAVQMVITQDAHDGDFLTTEDIQDEAPYLELADAEPIGLPEGIMGVAFAESQFPAHGSSTAHIWFAHDGNLYQVMADANYAPLLRSIIHTLIF